MGKIHKKKKISKNIFKNSTLNYTKSSTLNPGAQTERLPKNEDMLERTMKEYLDARYNLEEEQNKFDYIKNSKINKSPSGCRGIADISPEIRHRKVENKFEKWDK